MLTRVDDQLRTEARRYALRFTCDACLHFDADRPSCSHGYPHHEHQGVDPERVSVLSFCKLFELG